MTASSFDLEKYRSISFTGHRVRNGQFFRDQERRNTSELDAYEAAVKEGSQPDGTQRWQTDKAKIWSDKLGVAYRGDDLSGMMQRAGKAESRELTKTEKEQARRRAIARKK